jgi:phenylalanyl-tRNA synthetase alpha chain
MSSNTTSIDQDLAQLNAQAQAALAQATDLKALDAVRVEYLGKKGAISLLKKGLKEVAEAERPAVGAAINQVADALAAQLEAKQVALQSAAMAQQLASEALDVTMPGAIRPMGGVHPLTHVTDEISRIFERMGFTVLDDNQCPEVETDYYNFEALNFPADHPARDMQDTFYTDVAPHVLLRSQTSNAQIRYMESHPLPVRVVAPGRVYRNEQVSSRKNVLFHQCEGLLVDEKVYLSDLKGVLIEFVRQYFEKDLVKARFRGSFFPFTEPSVEMDIQCVFCSGNGCKVCGQYGWLEILGAGMVDPNVLQMVGVDPEKYSGFAFGMGIERLAMLKYGIDNIRQFYTNDLRWLRRFAG